MKNEKKRLILSVLIIPLALALIYEYYALLRCMISGGALTMIAVPALTLLFFRLLLIPRKKRVKTQIGNLLWVMGDALATPFLTVFCTSLLAWAFGIEIVTW